MSMPIRLSGVRVLIALLVAGCVAGSPSHLPPSAGPPGTFAPGLSLLTAGPADRAAMCDLIKTIETVQDELTKATAAYGQGDKASAARLAMHAQGLLTTSIPAVNPPFMRQSLLGLQIPVTEVILWEYQLAASLTPGAPPPGQPAGGPVELSASMEKALATAHSEARRLVAQGELSCSIPAAP